MPMWHGATMYLLSDRDQNKRDNIWAYDITNGGFRQITKFEEFDIHFPNIGPEDIVFENGGRLYLLNLGTEKYAEVKIRVTTDRATLKPHLEDVSKAAREPEVSPNGKRAVFQARGDIFTVPAEHGVVRNLTRSSGVAERFPSWSPDGKSIAYFTDRTGEYELAIRPADGSGREEILTKFGAGFRYHPWWSPDSKKLVFIDQTQHIRLHDLEKKETTVVGQELWMFEGDLEGFRVTWSEDGRWIAYPQELVNRHSVIALYDTKERKNHLVTSGYYNDDEPVWDPDGKYLFYRSGRSFSSDYSDEEPSWIYANTTQLMAVSLQAEIPSPLAPRNDDERDKDTGKDEDNAKAISKQAEKGAVAQKAPPRKKKSPITKKSRPNQWWLTSPILSGAPSFCRRKPVRSMTWPQ
jgi:tricorn protease